MTRRALLLAASCWAPRAWAQPTGPTPLSPGEVLRGRFVQERHLAGFARVFRTEGRFVLAPGRGLIWQAETPFAVRTVITATGMTQRIGEEETLRLSAARIPFLARLSAMLAGTLTRDWSTMERDFVLSRSGDAAEWEVILTPRRAPDPATMPFERITVRGGRLVEWVEMARSGGDTDTVRFAEQTLSRGPLTAEEARWIVGTAQ
jgi:hypothetical protein